MRTTAMEMADQLEGGWPIDAMAITLIGHPDEVHALLDELRKRRQDETAETLVEELTRRHYEIHNDRIAETNGHADPETTALYEQMRDEWPPLIPLVDDVELPTFPLHLLPAWVAEHAQQVAEDLQVAVDLPAILGLGALSVAALGRATVRYPRQRWTQPLNLYTAVALPPSAGKSPAKNAMFAALEDYELERIAAANADQLRAQSEARIIKKKLDDLEASAARNSDKDAAREAAELALELVTAEHVNTGRLMADDATTESLGDVLANAGGSIAVVSAEGGLFDKLAGMYSDKATNMDLFLEGWSGGRYVVDRIKRASISIPHANVAVVTTVQPHTLDAIGARKEFAGRGLTARFLLALPPSNVGHRDRRRQVVGDDLAEERYGREIVELAKRLARLPAHLVVVDAAADLFAEWDQELEDDLQPGAELDHLPEWVGKLRANMLRVAALLHVAHGYDEDEISAVTVAAVIELGEYFVAHARHIADRWGMSGEVSQATEIVAWIRRQKLAEFSVRDLHRDHQRLFQKADEMGPPLELLTERGWLRKLFPGELSFGRGRGPSPMFAVNPEIHVSRVSTVSRVSEVSEVSTGESADQVSTVSSVNGWGGESVRVVRLIKRGFLPLSLSHRDGPPDPPPPPPPPLTLDTVDTCPEVEAPNVCPVCAEVHPPDMCPAQL